MYNEQKIKLIEDGTYKEYCKTHRKLYKKLNGDFKAIEAELKTLYGENEKPLRLIKKGLKSQNNKLKKHISYLVNTESLDVYFGSYTIDDKKRKRPIKKETLKKYVQRILDNCEDYIINYDYGEENGRLHIHTIEAYPKGYKCIKDKGHSNYRKRVGGCKLRRVRNNSNSIAALSRYINKLTNHALKEKQEYLSCKKGSQFQIDKRNFEKQIKVYKNPMNCSLMAFKYWEKTNFNEE